MSNIRLRMTRGDDRDFDLTLTEDGAAMNLTGATVRFTAKRSVLEADSSAVIAKDSGGNGIVIDANPLLGTAVLTISAADTADLTDRVTTLVWDVQVTRAGLTVTPLAGFLEITADVTVTAP